MIFSDLSSAEEKSTDFFFYVQTDKKTDIHTYKGKTVY